MRGRENGKDDVPCPDPVTVATGNVWKGCCR
jgi:hypothetical protein